MIPSNIKFGGVYSKDKLPHPPQPDTFYIINLQSFNQGDKKGTHWVMLYNGTDYGLYYDPFGLHFPKQVEAYLPHKKIYWNGKKHQMMNSVLCGYYVIAAIKYLSQSKF